jgi:uncharacterized protein
MSNYLKFILNRARVVVFLIAAGSAVACLGLPALTITSDTRVFFANDNPQRLHLEDFEKTYTQNNNILFVISAKSGTMITKAHLSALIDFTNLAWQLPHVSRVDSLTNFPHIETLDDEFIIGDLVEDARSLDRPGLDKIRQISGTDPQLKNRLISKDLTTAGVNANFTLPENGSGPINQINDAAKEAVETFERLHPDLTLYYTGNVALMQVFSLAAISDIKFLLPISLLVILLVLLLTLRSIQETFVLSGILSLSAGVATGILGWINHPLDIATVVAPVIIMTLAMASCVHVVTAVHRHLRHSGDQREAIEKGLAENFHPIAMTSLTTIIGFLALNFADAPPFRMLGNLVIAGILVNFVFTFTLLPIFLNTMTLKNRASTSPFLRKNLANSIQTHRVSTVVLGLFFITTASLGIFRITLDDDFIRYFDTRFPYRQASDYAEAHLTGLNILEFDVKSGKEDGVFDPDYQNSVDQFTIWLRAQEKVANVTSVTDFTRKLHANLDPENAAKNPIPSDRAQIAQYYLLLDLGLPEGRSLSDILSTDQSSSRVTAILRGGTSGDLRRLNTKAAVWLRDNTEVLSNTGISINVLFAHLSLNNIRSMINGTLVSFVLISIVITILLRSMTLGFLSLVANSIPALVGFGVWGVMVGTVNLGASVLVAMTLGIVVDDTIHFLLAYQTARKSGKTSSDAAADAMEAVGPAMIITTIALIAGFGVLALSGFDVNKTLGTFTAIIIAVALAVDLLLLPAALSLLDRKAKV